MTFFNHFYYQISIPHAFKELMKLIERGLFQSSCLLNQESWRTWQDRWLRGWVFPSFICSYLKSFNLSTPKIITDNTRLMDLFIWRKTLSGFCLLTFCPTSSMRKRFFVWWFRIFRSLFESRSKLIFWNFIFFHKHNFLELQINFLKKISLCRTLPFTLAEDSERYKSVGLDMLRVGHASMCLKCCR